MPDKQQKILDAMRELGRAETALKHVIHYAEEIQQKITKMGKQLEELRGAIYGIRGMDKAIPKDN